MKTPIISLCSAAVAVTSLALLAGFGRSAETCCGEPEAKQPAAPAKPTLFDQLKPLVGTWEMKDEKGQVQTALVSKLTSAGHVFCETMFPGSEHEMTNMYHLDGDALVITHYCALGNQPKMKCKAPEKPGVFTFTFDGGTNIAKDGMYMGELKLTITDNDHIKQEWTSFKDGKVSDHNVSFELTRKK